MRAKSVRSAPRYTSVSGVPGRESLIFGWGKSASATSRNDLFVKAKKAAQAAPAQEKSERDAIVPQERGADRTTVFFRAEKELRALKRTPCEMMSKAQRT